MSTSKKNPYDRFKMNGEKITDHNELSKIYQTELMVKWSEFHDKKMKEKQLLALHEEHLCECGHEVKEEGALCSSCLWLIDK